MERKVNKQLTLAVSLLITILIMGCGSSPSDPGVSDTPSSVSPANGETLNGPEVTFAWDAVTGATKYYHQIDSSQSMLNPTETVISSPSVNITPDAPGTWWWRVRASVSGQSYYTPWSDVWSFTLN